ncbi:MAG: UvrD-helicase domain-containing protein [Caulobacter sp.]|nr:UvrD-helicase domain-containing protein [Caulobacter sp.]
MKTLPPIKATAEQLPLISQNRFGVEVIRGAAGSGKTSTALLRLRSLSYMFEERLQREGINRPVRILVLTFNRTLKGYVTALAEEQIKNVGSTILIDTFAAWAVSVLGNRDILSDEKRESFIRAQRHDTALTSDYLVKEVDYLLGRFAEADIDSYLTAERTGRGLAPRVDREAREKILNNVVRPYAAWKSANNLSDWNDLAVEMSKTQRKQHLDIVVVDEAQDFSANQLRAIAHHIAGDHAVTFVIDTVQRIYARGFTWQETGFEIRANRYHTLKANHRNTVEIAKFAAGVLDGLAVDDDGALPNLQAAARHGATPILLRGKYSAQLKWATDYIKKHIDLNTESVGFLQPAGKGFLDPLKAHLAAQKLPFVDITRKPDWPIGPVNIAVSTFHSAKGLEFDHVFILGLSTANTHKVDEASDDQISVMRRLFAVAIARARETVILGCKGGEESFLVDHLKTGTFTSLNVP